LPNNSDQQKQSDKPDQDRKTELVLKTSKAVWIWLLVLIAVLGILWYQTQYGVLRTPNFFATGDRNCIGALVSLDGKEAGRLSSYTVKGEKEPIGLFSAYLSDGQHSLKVEKTGYITIDTTVDMKDEFYFTVNMEPNHEERPNRTEQENNTDDIRLSR
jgi:hypothetical protein